MSTNLGQLLRQTDAVIPAPGVSVLDATQLVQKASSRTKRRQVAAVGMVCVLVASSSLLFIHRPIAQIARTIPIPADPSMAIQVGTATVDLALITERLARANERIAQLTPSFAPETSTEHSALTILYQADRLTQTKSSASAIKSYREVIHCFPDSAAAGIARQRLDKLNEG